MRYSKASNAGFLQALYSIFYLGAGYVLGASLQSMKGMREDFLPVDNDDVKKF
jgi:hypothetical protein